MSDSSRRSSRVYVTGSLEASEYNQQVAVNRLGGKPRGIRLVDL